MVKACPKCGETKPLDQFHADRSKANGVSSYCKACGIARAAHKWATKNEECRAYNRAYYQQHREQALDYSRKVRRQVLDAYGNECKCCGERTPEFLGVDHVNNDGEGHRRELKGYGRSIYGWLKREGFPQDGRFQLLCHNCNMAKGLYGGCPHQGKPVGHRIATRKWEAA